MYCMIYGMIEQFANSLEQRLDVLIILMVGSGLAWPGTYENQGFLSSLLHSLQIVHFPNFPSGSTNEGIVLNKTIYNQLLAVHC